MHSHSAMEEVVVTEDAVAMKTVGAGVDVVAGEDTIKGVFKGVSINKRIPFKK